MSSHSVVPIGRYDVPKFWVSTSHAISRVERVVLQEPGTTSRPSARSSLPPYSYERFQCFRTHCRHRVCLNQLLVPHRKYAVFPHNAPSTQDRDCHRSESEIRSAASEPSPSPSQFGHAPSHPTTSRMHSYPSALSLGHSFPSPSSTLRPTPPSRPISYSLPQSMYSSNSPMKRETRPSLKMHRR